MKILEIKISGYKNISEIDLVLGHFNALIALNNFGKSNLLEAIEFSQKFIQASSKTKSQMMQNQKRIPINNLTAGKDFAYEFTYETTFDKIQYEVNYSFLFEWRNNVDGKRIKSEILRLKKKEKDAKFFTCISRDKNKSLYLNSRTGRCDKNIIIEENNLIVNKLLSFDDLYYLNIIKEINNFDFSFFSLSDVEDRFSSGFILNETNNLTDEPKMSEVPSIAQLFYLLKRSDKNRYELLINSIKDLLPDIEYINPIEIDLKKESTFKKTKFIPFDLPEKIYDIRVKIKTNNQETSIKNLSSGSKRIFYVLGTVIATEMTNRHLLTFEELENSIHPALLQRLLMIISELTPNTQVIITSHAPHLIKYINLNDIYIGIPNSEGIADFRKIKKSKQSKLVKYAKDAETNIGDFIFDMLSDGFGDNSFWNDFI